MNTRPMGRLALLMNAAEAVKLGVGSQSNGDGHTWYSFMRGCSTIYTAKGIKAAEVFLQGYIQGWHSGQQESEERISRLTADDVDLINRFESKL